MDGEVFSIRLMTQEDRPLVLNSWVESHRGSYHASRLGLALYHEYHPHRIERFLKRLDKAVKCVVLNEEPDAVLGWMACHDDVLDYVYVKAHARKEGIARALIESRPGLKRVSHETPNTTEFFRKFQLAYDPYAFTEEPA